MLLKINNISVHYGKAMALHNVSMEVAEGSVVTLVGANGAGKTTLLRTLSGLVSLTSGEIWFNDKKINGMRPSDIVKLGLAHIPQARRLFPYITVMNNLKLGASLRNNKEDIKRDFEVYPVGGLHEYLFVGP
jgi:branched-chain amino acid transport system ATP-binding protein